ncbi:hypothetical protein E4U03_04075 [Rothia nasimurium]|uniref:Uncharacterized protein n=1 Tax=Rothia nasimurium TaxID=85336 RepID=A0A4Y9F7D3_9MICC|nr:hypothetical protein [Rothia nasimurium]MBF0807794.1 hypothetical protein [Rothia nasimurium]TFU23142.1 hypothetical protein E4U03_04075 [Rothia nasimurium]
MIEFRSILPADCVLEATPKAITLNIERTDAYLGEPLLAGYRERSPLARVGAAVAAGGSAAP